MPTAEQSARNRRYGRRHREARAAWAQLVASGKARCTRCRRPIAPDGRWHLDHHDGGGAEDYAGAAHASCNISAPGVRGAAALAQQAAGRSTGRATGGSRLTDDQHYTGHDGVPVGTVSDHGRMVRTGGGWVACWAAAPLPSGGHGQ